MSSKQEHRVQQTKRGGLGGELQGWSLRGIAKQSEALGEMIKLLWRAKRTPTTIKFSKHTDPVLSANEMARNP